MFRCSCEDTGMFHVNEKFTQNDVGKIIHEFNVKHISFPELTSALRKICGMPSQFSLEVFWRNNFVKVYDLSWNEIMKIHFREV